MVLTIKHGMERLAVQKDPHNFQEQPSEALRPDGGRGEITNR
jgi:hypothetical protein